MTRACRRRAAKAEGPQARDESCLLPQSSLGRAEVTLAGEELVQDDGLQAAVDIEA